MSFVQKDWLVDKYNNIIIKKKEKVWILFQPWLFYYLSLFSSLQWCFWPSKQTKWRLLVILISESYYMFVCVFLLQTHLTLQYFFFFIILFFVLPFSDLHWIWFNAGWNNWDWCWILNEPDKELNDLYLKSHVLYEGLIGLFSVEIGRTWYYFCRGILGGGFFLSVFGSRAN